MSRVPFNDLFKKQQRSLIPSTFKKGFISAVHTNAGTVDVSFAQNPLTIVKGIPVASTVNIANVVAGQRCRVDVFDETNPKDMVMAFTY